MVDRPGRGREQIGLVLLEATQPFELVSIPQTRLGARAELCEIVGVATAQIVELASLLETLERVLLERLQHRETRLDARLRPDVDQVPLGERH
jgi:hypothetical protein